MSKRSKSVNISADIKRRKNAYARVMRKVAWLESIACHLRSSSGRC